MIANEFQNLKKGEMIVTEYTTSLSKKMELVPYLVPTELSKIKKFSNELLTDFSPLVKSVNTLEAAAQISMSLEYIVERKIATNEEAGEKRKGKEILEPNNRGRILKCNLNGEKPKDNNDALWCERCINKHFG